MKKIPVYNPNCHVYEIIFYNGDSADRCSVRAVNAKEAKRILKKHTGALIKDMKIFGFGGWSLECIND